jgi:hypothetical protein
MHCSPKSHSTHTQREWEWPYPIGMSARSNPPNLVPISLKTGQQGTVSSSWPSLTALYPVSPANHTLTPTLLSWVVEREGTCSWTTCSIAHEAHSDLNRSRIPRPVKCWLGVQVRTNSPFTVVSAPATESLSLAGRGTVTIRESHQSRQCVSDFATPLDAKYASFPKGANICGL